MNTNYADLVGGTVTLLCGQRVERSAKLRNQVGKPGTQGRVGRIFEVKISIY